MNRLGKYMNPEMKRLLQAEPSFLVRQSVAEERERLFALEADPIIAELQQVGVDVGHLRDLRRPGVPMQKIVPVLVRWLPKLEFMPVKRDVVRTLGERRAGPEGARALLAEFCRIDPELDTDVTTGIRSAIGAALAAGATDEVVQELVDVASDRRHGRHRAFVVLALGNMRAERERAISALVALLDDDSIADAAIKALTRLKAVEVRERIASMARHADSAVRDEVKMALKRL